VDTGGGQGSRRCINLGPGRRGLCERCQPYLLSRAELQDGGGELHPRAQTTAHGTHLRRHPPIGLPGTLAQLHLLLRVLSQRLKRCTAL
jgi:hypothetical protein